MRPVSVLAWFLALAAPHPAAAAAADSCTRVTESGATAVWTDRELIVWGGFDRTGEARTGFVVPMIGWRSRPVSTVNAPAARQRHVAVWTGRSMLVWGGVTDENAFLDGAAYDPRRDRWTRFRCPLDIPGRRDAAAAWTGAELIVWGGINGSQMLGDGLAYDPSNERWRVISNRAAPSPRAGHVALWTGREIIVWGGRSRLLRGDLLYDGARYDPVADRWVAMTVANHPAGRQHACARIAGNLLIVGEGAGHDGAVIRDKAYYDLDRDAWVDPGK